MHIFTGTLNVTNEKHMVMYLFLPLQKEDEHRQQVFRAWSI